MRRPDRARAIRRPRREPRRARWYGEAKSWYQKAQAAKPGEFALKRATIEFLLRTNQLAEVETQLTDILKRPADFNPADLDWARRTLALSFVVRSELQSRLPAGAQGAGRSSTPPGRSDSERSETPEDLRVLARVYEAQKIPAYRKKAVEVLEKLNNDGVANAEDQFLLARIYSANDEWDKARSEYQATDRGVGAGRHGPETQPPGHASSCSTRPQSDRAHQAWRGSPGG